MATSREYAYFLKGNKIAVVERDITAAFDNDLSSRDYGPDVQYSSWKSPKASVADGLEIEYSYSPKYILPPKNFSTTAANRNFFSYIGWTAVDGYLTFLTGSNQRYSSFSTLAVDSHIVIQGSNRWNGLHKIQEVQNFSGTTGSTSHGGLKTYTKVNQSVKTYYENQVTWVTDETITGLDIQVDFHSLFQPGLPDDSDAGATETYTYYPTDAQTSYIHISGADAASANNGFFTNWKMDSASVLNLSSATKYMISGNDDLDVIDSTTITFTSDVDNPIYIYESFLDPGFIYAGVDTLNDESDNLNIPDYLAKAVVYYVKAKVAEDMMQIEEKEYFMKEFRSMIEKHNDSRKWGSSRVMPDWSSAIL